MKGFGRADVELSLGRDGRGEGLMFRRLGTF